MEEPSEMANGMTGATAGVVVGNWPGDGNAREGALENALAPLAAVLEAYDSDVCAHGERVSALAAAIANTLELAPALVESVRLGGRLHDLGLVGVSSDIVRRPGALAVGEYDTIKNHCLHGYSILHTAGCDEVVANIVLQHHERLDGSGYPQGLRGEEIAFEARIVAVADTLAAMAYDRPHRPALGIERALESVAGLAGTLFDAEVVAACSRLFTEGWTFPVRGRGAGIPHFRNKRPALRVAALFDDNPYPVVITGADMRVLDVNSAFAEVTGFERHEVVGGEPLVWHSDRHDPGFLQGIWTEAGRHGRWRGRVWHRRKDGSEYPAHMDMMAVRDDQGKATDFIGFFTDLSLFADAGDAVNEFINELSRKNNELMSALGRAEASSTAKSHFLASMSHELRTPLTAVIGFADAILSQTFGPLANIKHHEYIENIRESGLHLLDLITDMLDVSKIEAGKLELDEETVQLHRAAEGAVRLVAARAETGRVRLSVDVPGTLPGLRADGRRLKEILLNLLSNAIKFTPPGGAVTLRCFVEANGDGDLVLVVEDTGIGMDASDIPKALTPFGRVRDAWIRDREGTGLGLPLTKGLIELHHGTLELTSAKGVGTVATVRFPASRVVTA